MGAVTGETALYPCLQEKKEGKKTMSTKDVSCLAAPWVNSEPCGGVVVLPGALTHHVCVWLVPSPWQHWGGGWAENQAAPSLSLCQSSMARHPNGAALSLPVSF